MDITKIFNQYLGKPVEAEDPGNLWQCFDWAFKYCDEIGVPRSAIRHLNAYQIWTEPTDETLQYFDYIPNTFSGIPHLGDIVVFSTLVGSSGHVSIATGEGSTTSFKSTDQNWGGIKKVVYVTHNYEGVLGWLRPISQETVLPWNKMPQYLIDLFHENNLDYTNEGQIREFIQKAKDYDGIKTDLSSCQKDLKLATSTPVNGDNSPDSWSSGMLVRLLLKRWLS